MRIILIAGFVIALSLVYGIGNAQTTNEMPCHQNQNTEESFGRGVDQELKNNPTEYTSRVREFYLEAYKFGYTPSVIKVKKGNIVRLLATSRDTSHGVYIKEYDINVILKKGEIKEIEFLADKVGEFPIICSVYCGRGHSSMTAKLIVQE